MSWQKNQLGQMFRSSDLNYTAAITTKCPHFLQIVLENKLTQEYSWQPTIHNSVSFWATETCEYSKCISRQFPKHFDKQVLS